MHRELAHISSKLAVPIELQGRTVRKSAASPAETFGSWEKLLSKTKAYHRIVSPNQVAERTIEAKNANRILNPHLSDEQDRKTRKIKSTKGGPEDPGNMLNLLRKSGTVETALNSRKKAFKGCLQTEQTTAPYIDKRLLTRPHPKKQEEWASNALTSPTCMGDTEESFFMSPVTSPTRLKRQDHLKSSIQTLPNDESTKKAFQDRDEKKILQSAHSPLRIQHLTSTFQDELFQPLNNKKDPNRQNYKSYEEDGRLHPYSKGKKVEYPQYLERNTSTVMSPKASALVGSPRYGGMEPLNALFNGRRNIAQKPSAENIIISPPSHKDSARGGTVFSYRTFSSQIF